jgi:hypothetical protein
MRTRNGFQNLWASTHASRALSAKHPTKRGLVFKIVSFIAQVAIITKCTPTAPATSAARSNQQKCQN